MPYDTKQREIILNFLKSNTSNHLTADEISEGLKNFSSVKVGRATLYRYLKLMEQQGCVKKYKFSGKSSACYQYIGQDSVCNSHYHLMCESCSEVIHVASKELDSFIKHVYDNEKFKVNEKNAVFYGLCVNCSSKPDL